MRLTISVLTFTAFATLTACGGSGGSDELRDADDIKASETAASAKTAKVGDTFELGNLRVKVSSLEAAGDDLGPWIVADLRVENPSDEEDSMPDAGIVCGDSGEQGGWQADSTVSLSDTLPAKSFKEGKLNVLTPEDGRAMEPPVECAAPAVLQMTSVDSKVVRIPVPDDVLTKVNAEYAKIIANYNQ